jgi:hypothetical protein
VESGNGGLDSALVQPMTDVAWERVSGAYRFMVVAQTLALTIATFWRVDTLPQRDLYPTLVVRGFLAGALVLMAVGIAMYARVRKSRERVMRRRVIVGSWGLFILGGMLALAAYIGSGDGYAFVAVVATLIVMHQFSPNRDL